MDCIHMLGSLPMPEEITNKMLLEAIQEIKRELREFKQEVNERFDKVDQRFNEVDQQFCKAKEHLRKHDTAFQRLYEKRTQMSGDMRIVKEEQIPEIRAHVGLAA